MIDLKQNREDLLSEIGASEPRMLDPVPIRVNHSR